MQFWELLLISIGLSMDALTAAVCQGLSMAKFSWKQAFTISILFGGFQALMPTIGWYLGHRFERYITSIDHWVSFALLSFLGGKMLYDALQTEKSRDYSKDNRGNTIFSLKETLLLSIATSIDALTVGITFAFLGVSLLQAASSIGIITFFLSFTGVAIGHLFGERFKRKATAAGGIILILIAIKILMEHLGYLSF